MREPARKVWAEKVGEKVLNSFIRRSNGNYVYSTTGQPTINRQFINAAGIDSKYNYTLVDGFSEDENGLYTDMTGSAIVPVEIKYRSKKGNYQMNSRQLAIPGIIHLFYDMDSQKVAEVTFEELVAMPNWRICNQLQFNPDVPGKTLREVYLDMHADISRVERRLVEKDKDANWLYKMVARNAAEATLAAVAKEKIE
jgi:hypothetical protein